MTGLYNNNLLHEIAYGPPDYLCNIRPYGKIPYPENGIICKPSSPGLTLYLWATGHGRFRVSDFLISEISVEVPKGIEIPTKTFAIQQKEYKMKHSTANSEPNTNNLNNQIPKSEIPNE